MRFRVLFILFAALFVIFPARSGAAPIETYYSLGSLESSIDEAEKTVRQALESGGFEVIGSYSPAGDESLRSIVFTSDELISALSRLKPERMLAAALKVGLKENAGKIDVSIINPEFLFRAYTQKEFSKAENTLMETHRKVLAALGPGKGFSKPRPFGGGGLDSEKLYKYHYMFGMEYFEDMVVLNDKAKSFEEQVRKIEKNLDAKTGGAAKVYSIKPEGLKVAVYGVALTDPETGEPHFLPIIGTDHVAAMPYELIVIGDKALMLHGRYRIAIHWPALTMGTFGKIISTPGNIKETMRKVAR